VEFAPETRDAFLRVKWFSPPLNYLGILVESQQLSRSNMIAGLPLEILQTIARAYPCREAQIQDVATLYNGIFPPPRTLVAHGLEQTSKLQVISAVLEARSLRYVTVKCRECLSQRHLLAKIFAACLSALNVEGDADQYGRIDSTIALAVGLEKLFERQDGKVTLVLDSIDKQIGQGPTLLPALARLSDMVNAHARWMTRRH
jgi:origin recognition complex subunit 5